MRGPLRRRMFAAWERSISNDYRNHRINSERSLQASFWSELNKELSEKTWRLFIEPCFRTTVEDKLLSVYPDVVVCNSRSIVAVVELKYQPRVRPSTGKDLQTLELLSKGRAKLTLTNHRYRGDSGEGATYPFSEKTLFVWAGVHGETTPSYSQPGADPLASGVRALDGCFVQMHAETRVGRPPHTFLRAN